MGEHQVAGVTGHEERRRFTRALLADLDALERMLVERRIEDGPARFGAEQEMFLVDEVGRPAMVAPALLERTRDPRLTAELGTFNLEANLPPGEIGPGFLDALGAELGSVMRSVDAACRAHGARPLLTGILPTLHGADLSLANMSPSPRYRQLDANLLAQRGGPIHVFIRGVDELHRTQPDVMLEAANASYQLHLQVAPERFATLYNRAQLISAPLLAVSASSPLLFGQRLWHETRVALFELATDERSSAQRTRGQRARVCFGDRWVERSILEIYRADVARYPVLLARELDPPPEDELAHGRLPKLRALGLHNGTVWRWNRACYGVSDERAHVRIENRVLPSGPSIVDEVANAALFYGLMLAPDDRFGDIAASTTIDRARASFIHASRHGIDAQLHWTRGRVLSLRTLFATELLPAARDGLGSAGLTATQIDAALAPIVGRIERGQNGATWMLDVFERYSGSQGRESASRHVVEALLEQQATGTPVHSWPMPSAPRAATRDVARQWMTDIETVQPHDALELAADVMRWSGRAHVAVEDRSGAVLGLVSLAAAGRVLDEERVDASVADAMESFVAVQPGASLSEVRRALEGHECALVVSDGRLIGAIRPSDITGAR